MRLRTFGGLTLEGSSFKRAKPLLLLAYLALEGPKERWFLKELFWRDAKNPQSSLSTALAHLKNAGEGVVGADEVRAWCDVESDAAELLTAADESKRERVVELYRGPFLAGVDPSAAGVEVEEWIYSTREVLGTKVRQALLELGKDHASNREFTPGAELAQRAYLLAGAPEPTPEELERLFVLLRAGEHPEAVEVRKEAAGYELDLSLSVDEARAALHKDKDPTTEETPSNLPVPSTRFVGREAEKTRIAELLADPECRLLTIMGPGGIGKTRLAVEVATAQLDRFTDGVFFVALEDITSPGQIPTSIASAAGLRLQGRDDALEQVERSIGPKDVLLVLDNFEHLMGGALVPTELLQACPNLKVIVTSREHLNVAEEQVRTLEGLPLPGDATKPAEIPLNEAVQLFTLRARAKNHAFELGSDDLVHASKLVRLVEGNPLAIELAAPWVRLMPVADIVGEIDSNTDFLASSSRDEVDRHRSARAAFEHSWNLLTATEQDVLTRLSVFRAGFSRKAASEVTGATLGSLASLVDKSLLRVSPNGRFSRHALILQYTREKLADRPEAEAETLEKHARCFLRLAEEARSHIRGEEYLTWLDRFEEEHENLQAALGWSLDNDRGLDALRLVDALGDFWTRRGYLQLGWAWSERTLAHPRTQGRSRERAGALERAGTIAGVQRALSLHEESLTISQELGDKKGIAEALHSIGSLAMSVQGDFATARSLYQQSLALSREIGDSWGIALSLKTLGTLARVDGEYAAARSLAEESLAISRPLEDRWGIAYLFNDLGRIDLVEGNFAAARSLFEQSLAIRQELKDSSAIAFSLNHLGDVARAEGEYARARSLYEESLAIRREVGETLAIAWVLHDLGTVAQVEGDIATARSLAEEALAITRELGNNLGIAGSLNLLGELAQAEGDSAAARSLHEQSLATFREVGDKVGVAECLEGLALIVASEGHAEHAARLWGTAEALREAMRSPMPLHRRDRLDPAIGATREALGDGLFLAAWEEGRGMTLHDAIDTAMAGS